MIRSKRECMCILTIVMMVHRGGALAMDKAAPSDAARLIAREWGAAGDGTTNDTSHIRRMLDAIGDTPTTLVFDRGVFVVDSLSFPDTLLLLFAEGGQLAVNPGERVEINGRIDAGMQRLFSGEGTVSGRIKNLHVYPQWFGATGDGVHDDADAMRQAADLAATAIGRTLFVAEGVYRLQSTVSFRCNVENRGLFVIDLEIDEDRTEYCNDLFLPTHYPKHTPEVRFVADHPEQELNAARFMGIQEGDMTLPAYRDVPLADGSGHIDIEEGGVVRFYSADFFSSRNIRKGAEYYDRNDICRVVSGRGEVFPEFAFSYARPSDAAPWDEKAGYVKGDYCTFEGEIFKATWASGPSTEFRHRHLGEVAIGSVRPNPASDSTYHAYIYRDGTPDSILIWRRVCTRVWYRPKDTPMTVNGLRIEVRLKNHGGETKRIAAGAVSVSRSNMTFNNLRICVRDREATMSWLLESCDCVNNEFNNGYFSGATSAHLGYNILNSNVASFRYNHCISTNSRKGMDGRHGKNIHVSGGYYNIIDDHYGRNYVIRDITLSGLSVYVPNDSTPQADLQNWYFGPRAAISFNGANFHIQNITLAASAGNVMGARSDVGDLYGIIVLRDVDIRGNDGEVQLFRHSISPDFDYAHDVKVPARLVMENITLENPGGIRLLLGTGFGERPYGSVYVRNATVSSIFSASPNARFNECAFVRCSFSVTEDARFHFLNCVFSGNNHGVTADNVGIAKGNTATMDAECSFPLEYRSKVDYRQ